MREKDKVLPIRISVDDYSVLEQRAKESGLKISTFVREAALGTTPKPKTVVPEISRQTYVELHKIGVNLNQAVRALNAIALSTGQESALVTVEKFEHWVRQLQRQLGEIRRELAGVEKL